VEGIEESLLDAVEADPQFVDPVAEEIRFGPTKVVPNLSEPLDANEALETRLQGKSLEPFQNGAGTVVVTVENDFGSGHRRRLLT
jgi:hypothetical protein